MSLFIEYVHRLFPRKGKESYIIELERILGFAPHNAALYRQALIHCSVAVRSHNNLLNNERLEFLGDAILSAVVSDILFRKYEGKREGFLTNSRSNIVKRSMLNELAEKLGLNRLIISEGNNSLSHHSFVAGNAFEALIGAIYLDCGYECCHHFIKTKVLHHLIDLDKEACRETNYKSRLLEWVQRKQMVAKFELVSEKNDGHGPVFDYRVRIEGTVCGWGEGFSKKECHQLAAKRALRKVMRDGKSVAQLELQKQERLKEETINITNLKQIKNDEKN